MTMLLKIIFTLALIAIVGTTGWASMQMPVWDTPRAVVTHPWFIATLVDTYLAFFTFWLWVAYKERSNRSEEHTSELQSLMSISYAVFCLTKTNANSLKHFCVSKYT